MSLLNFQFKEGIVDALIFTDQQELPDYLKELIRKTRSLTKKSFGVGVVLAFPHEKKYTSCIGCNGCSAAGLHSFR